MIHTVYHDIHNHHYTTSTNTSIATNKIHIRDRKDIGRKITWFLIKVKPLLGMNRGFLSL